MANKMIIDASHPEETRVVVLRGNRVEEFDFESASKRQLRGNIYLAKVTRVEPSLQAAFIEYGGNRHGFLAFSEIHPDYYQIPVADRMALLEEEARRHAEEEDEEQGQRHRRSRRNRDGRGGEAAKRRHDADGSVSEAAPGEDEAHSAAAPEPEDAGASEASHGHEGGDGQDNGAPENGADENGGREHDHHHHKARRDAHDADGESDFGHIEEIAHDQGAGDEITTLGGDEHEGDESEHEHAAHGAGEDSADDERHGAASAEDRVRARRRHAADDAESDESAGGEEAAPQAEGDDDAPAGDSEGEGEGGEERQPRRAPKLRRHYKIQEVIKRRQVMLVQVVKEERGNKGAALTTYLSLAGRYSVLMPNTARGGGISRKITNNVDRKRLKEIAQELEVPDGMGIILRTAGASRSKPEVKRDFEYLLRMWEQVRELTLKSSAPMLTYEEGSLIKRAIRDLYSKEIDEVLVAGEAGYREAKDFMRMLMPGHSKNVIAWSDPQPIFAKAGVEAQLDAMFAAQVTLKSGGYIVINQTEALVAIDVNSGRSTREHNIEDTALRTNLEAADEIARQLRLRDLAGLIVIDFIDMEEHRNNRSVERRIKDALRNDRARIQIGRISHFGLLEMSRQRIRTGVLEGSTVMCAHCMGAGTVRSTASIALHVLRVVEDALTRNAAYNINVRTRTAVALYILNQKRSHLRELERRFGVTVNVGADDMLTGVAYHAIERGEAATPAEEARAMPAAAPEEPEVEEEIIEATEEFEAPGEATADEAASGRDGEPRREREPRRHDSEDDGGDKGRKRRRRRRGGRGSDREATDIAANAPQPPDDGLGAISDITAAAAAMRPAAEAGESETAEADSRPRGRRTRGGRGRVRRERDGGESGFDAVTAAPETEAGDAVAPGAGEPAPQTAASDAPARSAGFWPAELTPPAAASRLPEAIVTEERPAESAAAAPEKPAPESTPHDPNAPKRSGWWKRATASFGG